jgi:hypothetical protein
MRPVIDAYTSVAGGHGTGESHEHRKQILIIIPLMPKSIPTFAPPHRYRSTRCSVKLQIENRADEFVARWMARSENAIFIDVDKAEIRPPRADLKRPPAQIPIAAHLASSPNRQTRAQPRQCRSQNLRGQHRHGIVHLRITPAAEPPTPDALTPQLQTRIHFSIHAIHRAHDPKSLQFPIGN